MKTRTIPLLLTFLAACAGTSARQNIQLPALAGSWSRIKVQVLRADPTLEGQAVMADKALEVGDPTRIAAVPWGPLFLAASDDIEQRLDAKLIGPLVAESLRGRLTEFETNLNLFLRKP